ncbi:MAG: hypothetical protein ABSD67_07130 [Terracidiphilus sp.]|jgi:hypothetical protein
MGDLLQPWHLLVVSALFAFPAIVLGFVPFWFICKKAGFSPWLSLLNFVPCFLGTIALIFLLAFAPWPHLREFTPSVPSHL